MSKKRIIYLLLTLIMAVVILMFSSQQSEDSNKLSYKIDIKIFNLIYKKTETTSSTMVNEKSSNEKEVGKNKIETSNNKEAKKEKKFEYPVNNKKLHDIDVIVRKTAHVTLYAVLAIFLTLFIKTYNLKNWKVFLLVLIMCFLYACLDEYNQKIGGTRSGLFTDTLIDSLGSLIGITFVIAGEKMRKKSKVAM